MERPKHPLEAGTAITVAGRALRVARRAGTDERPIVRLEGVQDRDAAADLRGEPLLVEAALEEEEWLAADLTGCRVEGLGEVARVLDGPSCPLLELDDGTLVPFVGDAVRSVDTAAKLIVVDLGFLDRT